MPQTNLFKHEDGAASSPLPRYRHWQVGSSAFHLRQTLHDRQEARSGVAKIRRLVGEEEPAAEDEEGSGGGPKYARGMLKLELSDGFRTVQVSQGESGDTDDVGADGDS